MAAEVESQETVVLASSSPRRAELLQCLSIPFEQIYPKVDETAAAAKGKTVGESAAQSALAKAAWAAERCPGRTIVGADTIVVEGGQILGKPRGPEEAESMLRRLRGKTHQVITGIAVISSNGEVRVDHVTSKVRMRHYSDDEIRGYVASGDPLDKAGAYAVQSESFRPAESVAGCYLNVVGLAVCRLAEMLADIGVKATPALPDICDCCPER